MKFDTILHFYLKNFYGYTMGIFQAKITYKKSF